MTLLIVLKEGTIQLIGLHSNKSRIKLSQCFFLLVSSYLLLPNIAYADRETETPGITQPNTNGQSTPAAQKNTAPEDKKDNTKDAATLSGYVDTSYNYLSHSNRFVSDILDRSNDNNENGFSLQQFSFTLAKQPEQGLGGLLNMTVGRDAYLFASYGIQPYAVSPVIGVDLTQAYVQYAKCSWTTLVGKMNALVGYEANSPLDNKNFSFGLLSTFEPSTETGVRVTYDVTKDLSLVAALVNGWDNIRDWQRQKALELGITDTVNPLFSFAAVLYGGSERLTYVPQIDTGPLGTRYFLSVFGQWQCSQRWNFTAAYDVGWQTRALLPNDVIGSAQWQGLAGYATYQFNDQWQASVRAELFYDPQGFPTGVRQNLREATLSVRYYPCKNLYFRAETRHDVSNTNAFLKKNGVGVSNNQQSYALEAAYAF